VATSVLVLMDSSIVAMWVVKAMNNVLVGNDQNVYWWLFLVQDFCDHEFHLVEGHIRLHQRLESVGAYA